MNDSHELARARKAIRQKYGTDPLDPRLACSVDGKWIPLPVGFLAYEGCGHLVCERHASLRERRTTPLPLRCARCRKASAQKQRNLDALDRELAIRRER
jgi:hypothetical protein